MTVVVTLDVDWAPDWMVDRVADQLAAAGVPATWFVTHAGAVLERRGELVELGIHPNFRPGSSHGNSVAEVLEHVLALVPDAVSSRAHGVVQSGELLTELVRRTPIRIDSTTFLPGMAHVAPVEQRTPYGTLTRVPFVWSDDYVPLLSPPDWGWDALLASPGLKVLLFHPARLCLNHADASRLPPLPSRPCAAAPGPGPASAFAALLERVGGHARRLRDVVERP